MYIETVLSGEKFKLSDKYRPIDALGVGSCGVVISCFDSALDRKVAIKKIGRAFADNMTATRALREIRLLKLLNHKNLVTLIDIQKPPLDSEFSDIYIIQELMETNLAKVIRSPQPLSVDHVKYFMYQLLSGLQYLHSANVIHRDIKPANILVNSNCALKICDFGLATGANNKHPIPLTEYVVTRWYRSPEVILSCSNYDGKIDVWSSGCVLAELLQRKVLFPGIDSVSQMKMIVNKIGTPTEDDLTFIMSSTVKRFMRGQVAGACGGIAQQFPFYQDHSDIISLLKSMLQFNPIKRVNASEALSLPFFDSWREAFLEAADFDFFQYCSDEQGQEVSMNTLRELIWSELREIHDDIPLQPPLTSNQNHQTDTDMEMDDHSEAESYPHCTMLGLADVDSSSFLEQDSNFGIAWNSGWNSHKRNRDADSRYRKIHDYSSILEFDSSPQRVPGQYVQQVSNDVCKQGSESFDDKDRDSMSSILSGISDDDRSMFSSVNSIKSAYSGHCASGSMRPPIPTVAHHLVDKSNPFSSGQRQHCQDHILMGADTGYIEGIVTNDHEMKKSRVKSNLTKKDKQKPPVFPAPDQFHKKSLDKPELSKSADENQDVVAEHHS